MEAALTRLNTQDCCACAHTAIYVHDSSPTECLHQDGISTAAQAPQEPGTRDTIVEWSGCFHRSQPLRLPPLWFEFRFRRP